MTEERITDNKQPKDLISLMNKGKIQGKDNKEVIIDDDWEDYSEEEVEETYQDKNPAPIKERANQIQGKFDSLKAIVNNNEKNQVQKKYKNNKSFKGKNEGTFYPKPNSYGKKQYVNNNKEPDSFTNTNFNYANNNLNNSYANKIGKGYSNNQYNSESNSFSKPTFSNVNMKINSIIKVESDQITQSSEKTNQPPSFINSSINLNDKSSSPNENPTNNELFNNLSNIDLSNFEITNSNPNFSNSNPNYQKNNKNSTFTKKKYENNFSDERPIKNKDFNSINSTITRKFDKKPYSLFKFRDDKESILQKTVTQENSQIDNLKRNAVDNISNIPSTKKDDILFSEKPMFFNPTKETNEPLFKELDDKGDLYTQNLKMKGLLDVNEKNSVKSIKEDTTEQKQLQSETGEYTNDSKYSYKEKDHHYNKSYKYDQDKNYFSNKNYNNDKLKSSPKEWTHENHPKYVGTQKKTYTNYNNGLKNDDVWKDFAIVDDGFGLEENYIEGKKINSNNENNNLPNKNFYDSSQKFFTSGKCNLNLEKPQRKKNQHWDYIENRDYNNNVVSNSNTPILEKSNQPKTETKKVFLLVFNIFK